jgi:hypothetical protein
MQIRVWHLLARKMRYTGKINQVHFVFGCDSQCIGVPRMPFYSMECVMIYCRGNTQEKRPTSISGQWEITWKERQILRDVVCDQLRQFPNDKTSIRRHSSQSITVNCHICDAGCNGKHMWELKEGTVPAGSRNHADTPYKKAFKTMAKRIRPPHTSSHGICNPMCGTNGCPWQKDGILFDQGDCGGLYGITRGLNII